MNSTAFGLTGQRFGRLAVVRLVSRSPRKYLCECDCGTERLVFGTALTRHKRPTRSCGCITKEQLTKHGMNGTKDHDTWCAMIQRCYDPSCKRYPRYGGRGITVCSRWRESFQAFYDDMGPRPDPKYLLDRINNDGNYEPENCRWVSSKNSARNRSSTVWLTYNGSTRNMTEWAELLGFAQNTIRERLRRGWSVEKSLTEPLYQRSLGSERLK